MSCECRSTTEDNDTLERQKQTIVARIQKRTSALTKKLTIQSIKRAKEGDIPEAEAEVVDIPIARYVNVVDLTSPPRQKPRWSPENHIHPQQLSTNSLLKVFEKKERVRTQRIINGIRFQSIEELSQVIRENPDNQVLDPSECSCPYCPYSTGPLTTQRYILLERCHQIDNVFKKRPDLYGRDVYDDEFSYGS